MELQEDTPKGRLAAESWWRPGDSVDESRETGTEIAGGHATNANVAAETA